MAEYSVKFKSTRSSKALLFDLLKKKKKKNFMPLFMDGVQLPQG